MMQLTKTICIMMMMIIMMIIPGPAVLVPQPGVQDLLDERPLSPQRRLQRLAAASFSVYISKLLFWFNQHYQYFIRIFLNMNYHKLS